MLAPWLPALWLLLSLDVAAGETSNPDRVAFTRATYNASIPENSVRKRYVQPTEKMGIFISDPTIHVRYKIAGGDKDRQFKAEARHVGDFWFLFIRTRTENAGSLNREYEDHYRLKVKGSIFYAQQHKRLYDVHCEVVVEVTDTNDLNPLFYPKSYNVTVPEDTPLHQSVLKLSAYDPDLGVNGEIYYRVLERTRQFAIHPTMGTITLTRPLDYQRNETHEFTVVAEDRGPKLRTGSIIMSSTATVTVRVLPVNKHKPVIFVRNMQTWLEPGLPEVWAVVKVTDKDPGIHGKIAGLAVVDGDIDDHFKIVPLSQPGEFNIEVDPRPGRPLNPKGYTLTLRAWDQGTPSQYTDEVVRARLSDVDNLLPTFSQPEYDVDIEEVAPPNTPVAKVEAHVFGQEKAKIAYHIETGDDDAAFNINTRTGLITIRRLLDREVKMYYSLTVSASNAAARGGGQRKRTTTIVNIKVLDCNDNPPVFNESSAEVIYDENKPIGSKVYTAHAVDADEAENGYVSYSLVNLNHVPFSVDPFSGEIRTTEVLDFETMRRNYLLRIRATDWGIPYQRQAEMTLRVRVKDVNDHRPQFEKVDCVATVSKKAEIGTEILTLSAIDFDEGGTGTVSYKMEPTGEDSCFRLDPNTGVLTLACDLSQQQGKERSLNVTATDGRHFADVMKVLVRIVGARRSSVAECKDMGVAQKLREQLRAAERSNPRGAQEDRVEPTAPSFLENRHGPEFSEGAPSEISVDEDITINSVLVRLEAKDLDHGYNGKVLYVISDGDEDSCLRMDMHTGDLVLTAPLDRELTPMYILNITAYDQGHPPKAESRTLVVRVRDVNDNAPVFEKSSYSFILNENVANGTSVSRLRATDKDEGLNAEFRFVLDTDTPDFTLNPTSGLLTVAGPLDRERQEKYDLVVKLIDGDPVTPLTSTATVSVRLRDVNDNAPAFTLRQYMARVREDLPLGSIVTSMSAKDPDWGDGGEVHYEVIGKHGDIFDVDPDMGIVRLISALDFETCRIYNVTVAATDSGDPQLSSVVSLLVEVEDVNENLHAPVFPDMVANTTVDENQPKGTLVTSISAVDEDTSGNDGKVTYAIVDGDGMGVFTLDDKGDLRTSAVLDCEAKSHYWITIVAHDRAAVPLMSRMEMYIEVNDVNDNVPLTREPAYNPSVAENSLEGTVVVQLDAFDLDNSPGQRLSFAISGGDPHRHFQIDPESGLITTTSIPLDREMQDKHALEVTVSDAGDPPLSSTTQVVVTVTDVNDHQPRFLQTSNRFRVLEQDDQEEPVELCQVLASDRDQGAYGEIEYSIMQGAGQKFRINPATGAIYSRFALVNGDSHELLVKAFDQGDPSLYSTTKVQLHVVARPVSSAHPPKIKEVEVSPTIENDKVGHMVAVVKAVDLDGDSLWYTITGGNQENKFMIQKEEGLIQLARPLDWETTPVYNLTVEVTDGIGKASTTITVNIVDTNDNWPEFSESTFRAEISESIPSGTDIVQLTGDDADKDKRLFYSIYNSASALTLQKFTVDSLTGVLSARQTLDHEEARRHTLTVMVKDTGAPVNKRNFARVIIDVSDHNDHPPVFLSSMFEGKVYETVAIGTSVVDVRAVDRDRGRNAQMTFSIVSGNVGGTFSINPQLGTLTVAKELSQQTLPEYFLTVRATDHGEPPLNATVTVHIVVTIADNAPPRFDPPNHAIEVYENEKPGTFILSLTAMSRSSLYFEITSGNKGNSFSVDPSSGILSTNRALDYEWTRFYNLTVTATNLVGVNASTLVLVHVLDRNDNAPRFLQSRYDGIVSEAAEPGSVVLTEGNAPLVVTAEDEDSELNALLTFEIVEVWARRQFKVDSNTGALSIVTKLDRESISAYSFTVQVSDTGRPKLAARNPVPIHINVTDVNDTPPHFDHQYYNATLLLPTYQGVKITKVHATDPDLESPLGVKYTLVTGDHEGHFEVLQDTGDVLVRNPENLRDLYRLVISANDGQFETATFVIVTVGRSGEGGLRFARDSYEAHISENSTMVSVVTIVTVLGSALNEHVSFHILNPSEKFKIGRTSGVIRTTGVAFDRELVGSYRLVVEARSDATDPPRVAHVLVEVDILDENDNAPIFVNLPYYSVVPVEAKAGDLVRKVEAIDLDLGENGHIQYQLKDGHEMFHINPSTGDITLKQPLGNHNTDYTLVVIAKDNGIPSLQSDAVVPIKVVNRAMPVFPQQFYTVSVPENQQPHVPVLTVEADSPKGRQLIYSIVFGNSNEEFAVDFNTGVLYVVEHLDYETTQKYQLTLRATDSVNGAYADVLVSISVEDVNDFPPMFTQPSYNTSVSEAAPFATSILKVHATDRDTGPNAQIQYSLKGKAQATFHIDPSEGTLFIKASLDHETQPTYHLVVIATDNGSPAALSSTAHVWVTVMDMNDNPPAFQHPTYHCAIGELASRGQFVTRVAASDPDSSDKDKLVYSIVGGNEVQAFTINRKTGIITLSNLHQFPQQAAYVLNVSATDGVYLSHAKVIVTVLPSNEHPPVFTHTIYEAALPENESPGHLVATVVATDLDRSNYGRVTYAITSDDCARDFRIDPTTGDVFTTKSLDREVKHLYEVPVSAKDGGGRIAFTVLRVAVTDVNDNEPQFAVSEYRANIQANITVGTTILKVRAFDKDQGLVGSLQYAIHESNGLTNITSLFNITRDSGELYVKAPLSGKENNAYQFFVKVIDHGKPKALENVVPVTVVVMHPNEVAPQIRLTNFNYFLRESDPIGTVVLTLNTSQTHLRKGHDFRHHLTYSFIGAPDGSGHELDSSLFSLDEQGRMILVGTLDRETKSTYYLNVRVETELSLVSFVDLTVHVMDDNDNAPSFDTAGYVTSVAENVEEGCTVAKITAHDPDAGESRKITYEFYEGNDPAADIFQVDSHTGWITTLVPLDREAVPFYNFTVMARDDGLPPMYSTTWVYIEVLDVNDNAPVFQRPRYDAAIYEDAMAGTVIVTLETKDADVESRPVDFYIVSGDPGEHFGMRKTGEVYVNKALDRESTASYFLEVVATDGVFVAKTQLAIDVLDSNDNPPICLKSKYTELVSESIAVNTYILRIEATDADENRNAQMRYHLSGTGSDDFVVNASTGVLKTNKALDREQQSRYLLTAHVQDWSQWEWECTSTVEILLSDVNDNPPTFTEESYTVSVAEDVDVGTLVTKVHATDKDLGMNRRISYSFVDSARGHFGIDESSGIVRLNKPLDREERALYNLTVQARDHGTPELSSLATLIVVVQDVNDNPPEFSRKMYHATVSEAASIGYEVLRIHATSRDSGVNAEITYFLSGGNERGHFTINAKTGSIEIANPLDYEVVKDYFLTVLARDGGVPALSNQATVNISVTDYNDNPPVFGQQVYNAVVREDAVIGDRIIQVIARDSDSPANAIVSYAILQGDRHNQFHIEKETGYISLAAPLDRESISNYVLEVECTDSGTPRLASRVFVNIEASDVNDNTPTFSKANYSEVVQEGKPIGFTVAKFTVTDADAAPNAAPFTLDIVSGNDNNAFRIVQQDATLRTASKLDPKVKTEYNLRVRVTDSGTPPLSSETWVHVKVVEESQFHPKVSPLYISVSSYLDDFPGGVLGRIHASDKDPYDKLTYELVSLHQHLFSVDREDGTLVALPGLDVGKYNVNVSVSDGKFTTHAAVIVEVDLVSEEGLASAVGIRLDDVTPEDFLVTYKKGFLRGLRSLLNVRLKDVQIISIQPAADVNTNEVEQRSRRNTRQDLDVLFALRKGSHGYYSAKLITSKLRDNVRPMETAVGLKVVQVAEDRCTSTYCVHGECFDHMVLDRTYAVSLTTDTLSFVSPQHYRQIDCQCTPGFGGPKCEMAVNECSRKPCPLQRICVPDSSTLGYSCQCPDGKTGPACNIIVTCQDPDCYEEKHPISFGGKSYAHYTLTNPMDRRITLALRLRTIQSTGNLMYSAGARDYSILEVVNGCVQYRFDCGSGEGVVRVGQKQVSDGSWHEVMLERRGNFARLSIDHRYESSGAAPGVHDILNLDGNDMFFGAEVRVAGYDDLRMGFVGCLDDVRVDGILLPLHVSGGSTIATLRRFANVQFSCKTLFDPGVCGSQPCQNGGSCLPSTDQKGDGYTCTCLSRFKGNTCQTDTNPCASAPCLNGGTCQNDPHGGYKCNCPQRLSGKRCDYGRYCNPNPCQNGGICEEGARSHVCRCRGFQGSECQHDVDECVHMPCAIGATCLNLPGSFQCVCPTNATGPLCSNRYTATSVFTSALPSPLLEIVWVAAGLLVLFLLAACVACCWKKRRKQRLPNDGRNFHGAHPLDQGVGNEMTLKNCMLGTKDNVKRMSKVSNLDHQQHQTAFTTPPLPPRPASYTPSMQQDTALNNFDTVRSYGSAADDLESRYTANDLKANLAKVAAQAGHKQPLLQSNSASDTTSLQKAVWDPDKGKIYVDKIPNDLKAAKAMLPAMASLQKNLATPTTKGPTTGVNFSAGLASDDLPGYTWDYSDLTTEQKPLANITEVPGNEVQDSSSLHSADSNSQNSQIDLLPSNKGSEAAESEYVGDSETNESVGEPAAFQGYDQLLQISEDDEDEPASSLPHRYNCHPNQYLPSHCLSSGTSPADDESEDGVVSYGFPSQGGRGFVVSDAVSLATTDIALSSNHPSCSDLSMNNVCDIEDSDDDDDTDSTVVRKPLATTVV